MSAPDKLMVWLLAFIVTMLALMTVRSCAG